MKIKRNLITLLMALSGLIAASNSAATNKVACVVVFDYGWSSSYSWFSNPHKGYCESSTDIGKECDLHIPEKINCSANGEDGVPWYQAAIDYAANRDSYGDVKISGAREYPVVAFSRGVFNVKQAIEGRWPVNKVGLHVHDGLSIFGTPKAFGESIIKLDSSWKDNYMGTNTEGPELSAMIFVNNNRNGDLLNGPITRGVWIDSLSISGRSEQSNSFPSCEDHDDTTSFVREGIYAMNVDSTIHGATLTLARNKIYQVDGNAIALGFYTPYVNSGVSNCGDDLCRQGKVINVNGTQDNPALILDNTICGVGYGGVTLIGRDIEVAGNTILKVRKTWLDDSKAVGSTMGISAGFVGASNVNIHHNVIEGGDYGIGSDGSFPVFIGENTYSIYWNEILDEYPTFSTKYPDGPYDNNGELALTDLDPILANQVILDLAAKKTAAIDDRTGFLVSLKIHANTITHSTVGISMFRTDWASIYHNIVSQTDNYYLSGVLLDHSINAFVYGNLIRWWKNAVEIRGLPYNSSPEGSITYWGSSYNGVGIRPPSDQNQSWDCVGNNFDGNINNIYIHSAGYGNGQC